MISYSFEFSLGQEASKSNSKYPGTIIRTRKPCQHKYESYVDIYLIYFWHHSKFLLATKKILVKANNISETPQITIYFVVIIACHAG